MNIVFLQVGHDPRAQVMVNSVKACNPSSRIIQCSDISTAPLYGVDEVFRLSGDVSNLMTFRLEIFAALSLDEPSVYVDTDMIFMKPLDADQLFSQSSLSLCRRFFSNDGMFNINFKNMNLLEYSGMSVGEVYPYLACFTACSDSQFWRSCHSKLLSLDKKFHFWYGDQEALREVAKAGLFSFQEISEAIYACLPENFSQHRDAKVLHFKGPSRKDMMFDVARQLNLFPG
jgi:hypothetical protein